MTKQELIKIAMRGQHLGHYSVAGHDGKMLWINTFYALDFARRYVNDCATWVIVEDYEVIEQSETLHTDYPSGHAQYTADVATLTEAGDYATEGDTPDGKFSYRIAHAAARFMPWALARLGGAS